MTIIPQWQGRGGLPVVPHATPGPGMAVAGEALARAGLSAMGDIRQAQERQQAEMDRQQAEMQARAERARAQRETMDVERQVAEAGQWAGQTLRQLQEQAPEGADGFEAQVNDAWTARRQEMLDNAAGLSPEARELLSHRLDINVGGRLATQAAEYAAGSRIEKQVNDWESILSIRANQVLSDPDSHDDVADDLAGLIGNLGMPPARMRALANAARANLAKAAVRGQIDRDPAQAMQWLDSGRFDTALDPDAKAVLRNGAEAQMRIRESEARGAVAVARGDMLAELSDTEMALRSGMAVDIDPARIVATLGEDQGRKAVDQLRQASRYGADAASIRFASPADIQALMEQRGAGLAANDIRGFGERQREAQALAGMVAERNRALAADPAAYVATSPAVAERWQGFQGADADGKAEAFGAYVTATLAEQERLGVPAPARRVLPKDQAARQVQEIQQAKPEHAADTLAGNAALYGRHWPAAYRDLVQAGLAREYQVLATVEDPVGRTNLAAALSQDKDALRQAVAADAKEIDQAVAAALQPLYRSLSAAPDGQDIGSAYEKAARLLAYRYAASMDATAAADKAAQDVATGRWDFVAAENGSVARAPRGVGALAERWGLRQLLALQAEDMRDVGDPAGVNTGLTPSDRQEVVLQSALQGAWLTNEDGTGWFRVSQDGQPVMLADGQRLEFSFAAIDQTALAKPYIPDEKVVAATAARMGWSEKKVQAYLAGPDIVPPARGPVFAGGTLRRERDN